MPSGKHADGAGLSCPPSDWSVAGRLDFSADTQMSGRHRLLDLAAIQRARERLRLGAIREPMARLDAEVSGAGDPRNVRELLDGLNKLVG